MVENNPTIFCSPPLGGDERLMSYSFGNRSSAPTEPMFFSQSVSTVRSPRRGRTTVVCADKPNEHTRQLTLAARLFIEAAERMGRIHDVLFANGYSGHDLERFLVRVLFCLFAEDTGIFEPNAFTTFVENSTRDDGDDLGIRIGHFFQILNTPKDKRQKTLDELLTNLPYVDGGLFEEKLTSPDCNRDIRNSILGATKFDWSKISPAVFGSLFQSIMNPKERRKIGAHYTTEENILKLINPLFMDDLRKEFQKCKTNKAKLTEFHRKLHSLIFFDPACGCGNFLVLAYRELRLLEMDVLTHLFRKDAFDPGLFFQVDVDQFYGIEIVEFPVRIAETALWLMGHQMNIVASEKFGKYFIRLPLQKSATIDGITMV